MVVGRGPTERKEIILSMYSKVKNDFNSKRTTYNWDHLKNCYIKK